MPIVSDEAYKRTEKLVNEFGAPGGVGQKLQNILLDIAQKKDNWVNCINHHQKTVKNLSNFLFINRNIGI